MEVRYSSSSSSSSGDSISGSRLYFGVAANSAIRSCSLSDSHFGMERKFRLAVYTSDGSCRMFIMCVDTGTYGRDDVEQDPFGVLRFVVTRFPTSTAGETFFERPRSCLPLDQYPTGEYQEPTAEGRSITGRTLTTGYRVGTSFQRVIQYYRPDTGLDSTMQRRMLSAEKKVFISSLHCVEA